jgi:hypothetical protein
LLIWLERHALDRLDALRQPGSCYSEVILRMTEIEASQSRSKAQPMGRPWWCLPPSSRETGLPGH